MLPEVNAPAGKKSCVLCFSTPRPGVTRARQGTRTAVETKLQTHAVDLVRDGLDAVRPLAWVWNQVARAVSLLERPAVVDIHVLVADILQTERDELVGRVESVLFRCRSALGHILDPRVEIS